MRHKADRVLIICGHCELEQEVGKHEISEPVDAFGDFIDIFFKDQEYARLTRREEKLYDKGQFSELVLVYSFLSDISQINCDKFLEEYEKNKDPDDLASAEKWKETSRQYEANGKKLQEQLDSGIIEDADLEDEVYEEAEDNPFDEGEAKVAEKPKRRAKIEDILGDIGFLEF